MNIDLTEWLTLQQVAELFNPPITREALRLRLKKPNAPIHRLWRHRWLVHKEALFRSDWVN